MNTEITSYSHDGRGIVRIDGKTTFVAGALVGEEVTIEFIKKHSQFDEAKVIEVLKPSADRVPPKCPHFDVCGGCSLQHIKESKQIVMKQEALLDQFSRTSQLTPKEVLAAITRPVWGYRHKARLGVKYVAKKQKVLVGFREKNGSFLADLNTCEILHPSVGKKIKEWSAFIETLSIFKHIPQLEVAVGDDATAIIIRHLKPFSRKDIDATIEFAQEHDLQIYLQPKGPKTIHKIWPMDDEMRLHYRNDDLNFAFHPADFTQVNPEINKKMVALAMDLLDLQKTDSVLDLFCGLGNFTLPIAKRAGTVVGVEGSEEMVERASENALANGIENASFYSADLAKELPSEPWVKASYDKLLLDPPRSGVTGVLPYIEKWNPKRIVYVSCNPATLARDAGEIVAMGYTLEKAGVMDMFPHTSHVESIALFVKE